MRQELAAHSSPWRMALILIGAGAFVALGLWMTGLFGDAPESRRWSPGFVQFIGWSSVLFFGACAIVGIRRAVDTDAQLEVTEQGIHWKPWSQATIPWHEISDVRVWEYRRQRAIVLCLKHPERYPSTSYMGKWALVSRRLTGGDIPISLTGMDKSFDEALAAIHDFLPAQ